MNRTQIYLPKTQLEALREFARKRRVTVSHIVRSIVDERFSKRPKTIQHETLISAAKRINRLGKSGPKDLALNVDKYLYGAPARK